MDRIEAAINDGQFMLELEGPLYEGLHELLVRLAGDRFPAHKLHMATSEGIHKTMSSLIATNNLAALIELKKRREP